MAELLSNKLLVIPTAAWFIAQLIKVIWTLATERRLAPSVFVRAGGMPSAHSAVVTALTVASGQTFGVESPIFAVSAILASIVMYDAAGVRRAVGIQAGILNRIIDEYYESQQVSTKRLGELVGHTPIQVIVGALLGAVTAWFWA